MSHPCVQEGFLGQIREFMDSQKSNKYFFAGIISAIIIQIAGFLIIWGSVTTTVKIHDRDINRIMTKLDNIKLIGYVQAATVDSE